MENAPGALMLVETINLMMGTLLTKAHIITSDKATIIQYWNKAENIGALTITGRQLDTTGREFRINHACRIVDCTEDQLLLMNPDPKVAEIIRVPWESLPRWKGYVLLLE